MDVYFVPSTCHLRHPAGGVIFCVPRWLPPLLTNRTVFRFPPTEPFFVFRDFDTRHTAVCATPRRVLSGYHSVKTQVYFKQRGYGRGTFESGAPELWPG